MQLTIHSFQPEETTLLVVWLYVHGTVENM